MNALLLVFFLAGNPAWEPLRFLVGEWEMEGQSRGVPGAATAGAFSFTPDLQQQVLVRRSFAQYANSRHDDLMVVFGDAGKLRAAYFDNEGHAIRYSISAAGNEAVFLSDPDPGGPRFRLTYTRSGPDRVELKFEVAPPGKPGAFSTYVAAAARRVK